MLDRYLRKNFGKFVELGEFGDDHEIEQAFRRYRVRRRTLQLAVSAALLIPVFIIVFIKFGGVKGPSKPKSVEEYYHMGVTAYEEGNYEKAWSCFAEVVRLGPPEELSLNTYLKLADSLYNITWPDREEPYREALKYYQKALGAGNPEQIAPHIVWIYYQMGNCQRNVRAFDRSFDANYSSAVDYYDEVITNYPSSAYAPHAIYYKAACYRGAEKFIKAREIYYQLYKRYPRHKLAKDVFFDIADCFIEEAKHMGVQVRTGTVDLETVKTQ